MAKRLEASSDSARYKYLDNVVQTGYKPKDTNRRERNESVSTVPNKKEEEVKRLSGVLVRFRIKEADTKD